MGFPGGSEGKASASNVGDPGSIPRSGRFPWRRKWQPSPVSLPGKSHGQRSLVGYSPWGHKESDTTERLHFHLPPVIPHEYSRFSQHRMHHMFFDLNDLFLFFPLLSGLYSTMMSFWAFASSHGWTDPRVSRWLINLVFDTWVFFIWHLLKIFSRVRFLYWCVLNWVYE